MASTTNGNNGRCWPWTLQMPVALGHWVQLTAHVDGVMGNAAYDWTYQNQAGAQQYATATRGGGRRRWCWHNKSQEATQQPAGGEAQEECDKRQWHVRKR